MSGIDCERFATLLAELLAEAPTATSDPRASWLRAHAERCSACAASAELVELAATPSSGRDPIDDPGASYWDDFGRRLEARLATARTRRRLAVLAAAAAVAAGAVVWIGLSRQAAAPIATGVPAPTGIPSATSGALESLDEGGPADDDAAAAFAAEPLDAYADDDATALFPSVDQLSPAESDRLLLWLEQEEARVKRGAT